MICGAIALSPASTRSTPSSPIWTAALIPLKDQHVDTTLDVEHAAAGSPWLLSADHGGDRNRRHGDEAVRADAAPRARVRTLPHGPVDGKAARKSDAVAESLAPVLRLVGFFELQLVLGIERFRAPARSLGGKRVPIDVFLQIRVGAGQVMGNGSWRRGHFRHVLAGEQAGSLSRIQEPGLAAHERLSQHDRVLEHARDRQVCAVDVPVLGQPCLGAARHAVAAQVVRLEVRGRDRQRVAFPHAGREPLKGVGGVVGGCGRPSR